MATLVQRARRRSRDPPPRLPLSASFGRSSFGIPHGWRGLLPRFSWVVIFGLDFVHLIRRLSLPRSLLLPPSPLLSPDAEAAQPPPKYCLPAILRVEPVRLGDTLDALDCLLASRREMCVSQSEVPSI